MPGPPKFGDVSGEVRLAEVPDELDAEKTGGSTGNVGVAAEVAVDLKANLDPAR